MRILKEGKEVSPEKEGKKKKIGLIIAGGLVIFGLLVFFIIPGGQIQEQIVQQQVYEDYIPEVQQQEQQLEQTPRKEAPIEQSQDYSDSLGRGGSTSTPVYQIVLGFIKDITAMLSTLAGLIVALKSLIGNKKTKATWHK